MQRCDPNSPTLKLNSPLKAKVAELQQDMWTLGYGNSGPIGNGVDGIYGSKTVEAVKKYQTDNKLKIDGITGPQTWASLCSKNGT